jgi:pimeloyl-ACP methyl ester carboxylesterase
LFWRAWVWLRSPWSRRRSGDSLRSCTVAAERGPFLRYTALVLWAFKLAERQGHFAVDEVSPVVAASRIRIPVLLIHGEADIDTSPDHSRRVFGALNGPKRLIVVPRAAHNGSLRAKVWGEIERWIDNVLEGVNQ